MHEPILLHVYQSSPYITVNGTIVPGAFNKGGHGPQSRSGYIKALIPIKGYY